MSPTVTADSDNSTIFEEILSFFSLENKFEFQKKNISNNYLKGIDLGLAYGFTTSKLGWKKNRGYGDLEIMVRYCFDIYKEEIFSGYGSSRNIYKNEY